MLYLKILKNKKGLEFYFSLEVKDIAQILPFTVSYCRLSITLECIIFKHACIFT